MRFTVIVNDYTTGHLVDADSGGDAIISVVQEHKRHNIDVTKVVAYHVIEG